MKVKTIIFDLDGTIADTLPLCIAAFRASVQPFLKREVSEQEIVATFGPSEEGTIHQLVPGNEAAAVKAYLEHYEAMHHTCAEPFAGITELLDTLKQHGAQLAMVTGKGIHSTRISLSQFNLEQYFEVLETGSPDGPNKIAGIRNVLNRLNANAETSLYIGDSPSDITYSKAAGVPVAAAAWAATAAPDELIKLNPDYIFYTVDDFKSWILASSYIS